MVALVGFLPAVDQLVSSELRNVGEGGVTLVTVLWFNAGVHGFVKFK